MVKFMIAGTAPIDQSIPTGRWGKINTKKVLTDIFCCILLGIRDGDERDDEDYQHTDRRHTHNARDWC